MRQRGSRSILRRSTIFVLVLAAVSCALTSLMGFRLVSWAFVIPRNQPPEIPPSLSLRQEWCASPGLIATQLTMSDNMVFARVPDAIAAIQKDSGAISWTYPIRDDSSRVPPPVHEGRVLVISEVFGTIALLDALTGQAIWSRPEALAASTLGADSITIGSTTAYVTWANYGITSYDMNSGLQRWVNQLSGARIFALAVADQDDNVYVTENKTAFSLDKNAAPRWSTQGGTPILYLTLYEDELYFFQDGALQSVRTSDGSKRWTVNFDGNFPVRIGDDELYASGHDGQALALSRENGQIIWHASLPTGWSLHSPVVYADRIYVESLDDGIIFALDRSTGQMVGEIKVAAQLTEPNLSYGLGPATDGTMLFVPSGSLLCAYTSSTLSLPTPG